jgi:hypothetical protein
MYSHVATGKNAISKPGIASFGFGTIAYSTWSLTSYMLIFYRFGIAIELNFSLEYTYFPYQPV